MLPNGGQLREGDALFSNGFELVLQTDCNLVLYDYKDRDGCDTQDPTRVLWSSRTNGRGEDCHAIMQPDGNFVVYDWQRRPLWASGTHGRATGGQVTLHPDGDVVVAAGGPPQWRSNTGVNPNGRRECVNPFAAPEPTTGFARPAFGFPNNTQAPRDVVVICMDAKEPAGATLPPPQDIWDRLKDTQGWFSAVSRGRFQIPLFHQWGCGGGPEGIMNPDPKYQGDYFERFFQSASGNKGEATMHEFRRIAIETAQAGGFDVARFDRNGDGHIGGNELGVITVRPHPNKDDGSQRGTTVSLGRVRSVPAVDLILTRNMPNLGWRQALFVHELMHLLTGAGDMYDSPMFNTDVYSIMDSMSGLNWLDPFHSLKLGWLNARAFKLQGRGTLSLSTMDGAGDAAILYDPSLGSREYFIITRYTFGGINVWRIVEDIDRMRRSPWAEGYKGWLASPLGWGRWAVHRVTTNPLKQGERIPLQLTSGATGFFLTVEKNQAEGNPAPVTIRLER